MRTAHLDGHQFFYLGSHGVGFRIPTIKDAVHEMHPMRLGSTYGHA